MLIFSVFWYFLNLFFMKKYKKCNCYAEQSKLFLYQSDDRPVTKWPIIDKRQHKNKRLFFAQY